MILEKDRTKKLFVKHAVACINLQKNLCLFRSRNVNFYYSVISVPHGMSRLAVASSDSATSKLAAGRKQQLTCSRLIINSFRSNMVIVFGFTAFFSGLIIISKREYLMSLWSICTLFRPPLFPRPFNAVNCEYAAGMLACGGLNMVLD